MLKNTNVLMKRLEVIASDTSIDNTDRLLFVGLVERLYGKKIHAELDNEAKDRYEEEDFYEADNSNYSPVKKLRDGYDILEPGSGKPKSDDLPPIKDM